MRHEQYLEIEAKDYYDLGYALGSEFREHLEKELTCHVEESDDWGEKREEAQKYFQKTATVFPEYIDELNGYADSTGFEAEDLWVLYMGDELDDEVHEKCTTLVTNKARTVAHNEDWDPDSDESVWVVKKKISAMTILELHYISTLGGNSISINSHGIVQSINTLSHKDSRIGVPRNVVARWFSESSNPEKDIARLETFHRSAGYHHTFVSLDGKVLSLECSARKHVLTKPALPFVHTNHYLSDLCSLEDDDGTCSTLERYDFAKTHAREEMSLQEIKTFVGDTSQGRKKSLFNRDTIGRFVFDLPQRQAHIWLLSEKDKGWLSYELDFLPK